jgi:hypothetical protein
LRSLEGRFFGQKGGHARLSTEAGVVGGWGVEGWGQASTSPFFWGESRAVRNYSWVSKGNRLSEIDRKAEV